MPGVLAKAPLQHCTTFACKDASEQLPPHENSQVYLQMAAHVTQQEAYVVDAKIRANVMEKNKVNRLVFIVCIINFLLFGFY